MERDPAGGRKRSNGEQCSFLIGRISSVADFNARQQAGE